MRHYSRILYICLKCYIGIWIYYFIHLFYKKKCISVCARRSLNGCEAEWASHEASLKDFMWSYRLLGQKPFSAAAALLHVSANQGGNQKRNKINDTKLPLELDHGVKFTPPLLISTRGLKSERDVQLPEPAGWKIIKRGLLLWVKGMKVWLTGEITQSVSSRRAQTTCSSSADWHKLTTPQHISFHSQQTSNNSLSAWKSRAAVSS